MDELQHLHIPPISEKQTLTSGSQMMTNARHLRKDALRDESYYPPAKTPPREDGDLRRALLDKVFNS